MAIWTSSQKVTTKKLKEDGCARDYRVEVPAARLQEAMHNAFLRYQLRARVPGFRQGKAPLDLIKTQFAQQAKAQAVEDLLGAVVPEVIKELGLRPVASPGVSELKVEDGKPLSFELRVEVSPEFEPKGYKGLALTRKTYAVDEKDIAARLTQLQEGNARLERAPAEKVGKDHYAVIDYELFKDGKPVKDASGKQELVDMSSDQTVKGLREGLMGAARGETREFQVEVGGKPASCKAVVQEIKAKVLPALDDELAKDLGLEDLAALKKKLREIAEAEAAEKTEHEVAEQIEKGLLAANKFPVPPSLTESQLEASVERLVARVRRGGREGLPDEELKKLREKLKPQVEDQLRVQFILAGIAKKESVSVTEDDMRQELDKNLAKAESEEAKKDVQRFFERSKEDISALLRERKVLALVRNAAKVKEEKA